MYNEVEKKAIREEIIKNSIDALTTHRKDSTISNPDYIKRAQNFMLNESSHEEERYYGMFPTNNTFLSWNRK